MNSREKGARGERELANILKENGFDARRGQQFKGGSDSPDVIGIPRVHIECKRVERLNIDDAMRQSIRDSAIGDLPIVAHRKNGESWLVTMTLNNFIEIVKGERTWK